MVRRRFVSRALNQQPAAGGETGGLSLGRDLKRRGLQDRAGFDGAGFDGADRGIDRRRGQRDFIAGEGAQTKNPVFSAQRGLSPKQL